MPKTIIRKTIKGENLVGRILNKALPFPRVREAIGSAFTGTKRGLPIPELNDPDIDKAAEEALKAVQDNPNELKRDDLIKKIYQIRDILDNGKVDGSVGELSPGVRNAIEKGFSALPLVAYLIYGITTGDFSLTEFFLLFQGI